jgi:hypothetical protein
MGLSAQPGDDVPAYYLDPERAKGKRPGEMEMGAALCAELYKRRITAALTTWPTLSKRVKACIAESTAWEKAYGTIDKIPTGGAQTKRVTHNIETGEEVTEPWPWADWMWPFIRLGRQRAGQAVDAAVKKEECVNKDAQLRAEQTVARLQAALLTASSDAKQAVQADLNAAQARLLALSGGRRGDKSKAKAVKRESDDADEEEDSDSDAGGEGAGPTRTRRSGTGLDAGLAALLKQSREGQSGLKDALAALSAQAEAARSHAAAEAEKQHARQMELEAERAKQTERLLLGLVGAFGSGARKRSRSRSRSR